MNVNQEQNKIRIAKITEILQNKFNPEKLDIIDNSHKHIGHAGAKSGKGHFELFIKSNYFNNLNLIASHKEIYQALIAMFETDIHALEIKIL